MVPGKLFQHYPILPIPGRQCFSTPLSGTSGKDRTRESEKVMIFFATDLHGLTRILEILPCAGKKNYKLQNTKYKQITNHKFQITKKAAPFGQILNASGESTT
jgi:hypothetical protein